MNWNLYKKLLRLPYIVRLLLLIISIIVLFGTSIHWIEPNEFPSVFDGIWWAVITASTVGYGDLIPKSLGGRIIGIFLVLIGAGFIATFFGAIAKNAIHEQNAITKGTAHMKEKNHFVIIGWNERTKGIINNLQHVDRQKSVAIIDRELEHNPYPEKKNIFFIKGDASTDEILAQANMKEAELVLITSDPEKNELDADMNTILNIVAIKGFSPDVYVIAEILTDGQIVNAKRAGADEVIQTNRLTGEIMAQTMLSHGVSSAYLNMVDLLKGTKFEFVKESSLNGHTFETAFQVFAKEEKILIGYKRKDETKINPAKDEVLTEGDQLLVICKKKFSDWQVR